MELQPAELFAKGKRNTEWVVKSSYKYQLCSYDQLQKKEV
jgi:hypothetical protein